MQVPGSKFGSVALFFLLSFTAPPLSHAYRPFTTGDAGIVEKGKGQLEASFDFSASSTDRQYVFLMVPSFGAADFLELSVDLPVSMAKSREFSLEAGIGDLRPSAKFLIFKEKGARPALATQLFFKFDTGDESLGLGTGSRDAGLVVIISKTLWRFHLHGMIGGNFPVSDRSQKRDTVLYGFAVDYQLAEIRQKAFHLLTEVFGNINADPSIPSDPLAWFLGVLYDLSDRVSLDAGVGLGLSSAAPDVRATLGATFSF